MALESKTVVVVEDDPNISDLIDLYLRKADFRVLQCKDAKRAKELISSNDPVLAILDIGLEGDEDGLELLKQIRSSSSLPVILLTARDDEIDRIMGLEFGADDYVSKPFSPRELVARVKAVTRRVTDKRESTRILEFGSLRIDLTRREVTISGSPLQLATKEFDLLAHLAQNKGVVLSRQQLLDSVWGDNWYGDERTVDVHIRQIRKKLDGEAELLHTIWGVGYRFG
jgi:DNA-binding response OmpR family regulator